MRTPTVLPHVGAAGGPKTCSEGGWLAHRGRAAATACVKALAAPVATPPLLLRHLWLPNPCPDKRIAGVSA